MNNRTLIAIMFFLALFSGAASAAEPEVCLVFGQEADPVKGRNYFKSALEMLHRGQRKEAIENYEIAIIADHSILKHENHGLAMALLEKYRDIEAEQTPALLCKRGFLENILIGNLEDSVKFYEKAAVLSADEDARNLALDEAKRLKQQLDYLKEWQA